MTAWHKSKDHDPEADRAQRDHDAMMREGSRMLLWRIARLQAQREGQVPAFLELQDACDD